jgi:transcriptional regulator with XRE-family HTH domain
MEEANMPTMGEQVRSRRKELGLTQRAFSMLVGINTGHICAYERGTSGIKLNAAFRIATALGGHVALGDKVMETPQDLAEALRQRRISLGASQLMAAAKARVAQTAICHWENGKIEGAYVLGLEKYAQWLGTPLAFRFPAV